MSTALSSALALAAILLATAAVVLATVANRRWAVRSRAGGSEPAVVDSGVVRAELDQSRRELDQLRRELDQLRNDLEVVAATEPGPQPDPTALRHVALVRYDAFADVGGRLSYSVAVLDDTGSGLVLTTLAGKSDVRTYVRTISAGTPDDSLTAEEQRAIDAAVGSGQ